MLCEISDIFPGQIIWELSKVFWRSSTSLSHQKCENPKIADSACFMRFYSNYLYILIDFILLVFWYWYEVLCGISDIFPRQIIWELSKVFWRSSTRLSQQKCENTKIAYFVHFGRFYSNYMYIYVYVEWFETFSVLVLARGALWDLRYFS